MLGIALTAGCASNTSGTGENGGTLSTLVEGGPLHGAKGLTWGPDGYLYLCSVYAQSIYRIDPDTGEVTVAVGPPHGTSDDVAFAPDGTMVWTALPDGEIRALKPGGEPYVLADRLPLINPVGYTADGRLYASQIGIDRFLEIDTTGQEEPRLIAKGIGHLNSFEITPAGQLYGPLAGNEQLARIDIETGEVTVLSDRYGMISAVELDPQGQIYTVGWKNGELRRFDEATGEAKLIAQFEPPVDNLAIDDAGSIYVSLPTRGAVIKVDPATGKKTTLVDGRIGTPGGLAITTHGGRETLIMADDYGFRHVDTRSGDVFALHDLSEFMDPLPATDVAVNSTSILLSDVSRGRVYLVDRESNALTHNWRRMGTPYGVALTDAGEPLYADYSTGRIVQLSRTDRRARTVLVDDLDGPVGLVRAGNRLFVTEAGAGAVTRINLSDGSRKRIINGLNQPEGLTIRANGNIAVVEARAGRVLDLNPATGSYTVLAEGLNIGSDLPEMPDPINAPSGIVEGADGRLYLTSDAERSVLMLRP